MRNWYARFDYNSYIGQISIYIYIYTCISVRVHGCNIYNGSNVIWVRRDQPVFVLYGWGWVLDVCLYFLFFFLVHKITHSVVNIRTKFTTVLIEHIILLKSIHTTKYNRNIRNKSVQRSGGASQYKDVGRHNIKMSSCRDRDHHVEDKTVSQPCYL